MYLGYFNINLDIVKSLSMKRVKNIVSFAFGLFATLASI